MQNRYAGDVGDFGKFGLLRHIINNSQLKLGINWYLFPDEGHNEDGKYINYLSKKEFEICDEFLHNKLKQIVLKNRNISSLEEGNLFDKNPVYYSKLVDFYNLFPGNKKIDIDKRLELRSQWKKDAILKLSGCDAIFLDPDNGLQIKSCDSLSRKKSGKFVFYNEIREFHAHKKLTIIYHHLNRHKNHGNHKTQIIERANELKLIFSSNYKIFGIRYKPFSPRAFFLIVESSIESHIKKRLNSFVNSNWNKYWDNLYEA